MDTINKQALIGMLDAIAEIMVANKELLCSLDAEMGDGDLGLTMSKAFPAAAAEAVSNPETDLGKLLLRCGMKMNAIAPSTMGTLMSSGFVNAGKSLAGKTEFGPAELARFYMSYADGVANRGKAARGDRTVLDTLYPAADAAQAAAESGGSLDDIAAKAVAATEVGLEATKNMEPKFGKAAVFADKAIGKIDQGALVGVLLAQGIARGLAQP